MVLGVWNAQDGGSPVKVVIFAGGLGTRISEQSIDRPKPMVEIGGKPILWHIMKYYAHFGLCDFIICLGYKGYMIKEYFANYALHLSDVTIRMDTGEVEVIRRRTEPWTVTLIDTGELTQTGGRLKRVAPYLGHEDFCLTYGDGLADVNLTELLAFHRGHGRLATVTAVRPPGRFGALAVHDNAQVKGFTEKPRGDGSWINGGFFVLSPSVLDTIEGDASPWEGAPLAGLAERGELMAFHHDGFWRPMDTLRDRNYLEQLYTEGQAPWILWS